MKKILLTTIFLLIAIPVYGQVGFGITEDDINSLSDTDKGLLQNALQLLQQSGNTSDQGTQNGGLPAGIQEQISVDINPEIPDPGEVFVISIESFSSNLSAANIIWQVDGVTVLNGQGIKQVQLTAPAAGKRMVVKYIIQKIGGGTISDTLSFNPAEVDIIYEAQTYTPPFYKGRSIFTSESVINFVAIPNFIDSSGRKLDEDGLIFTWKIDYQPVLQVSGPGKNTFPFQSSLIQRPMIIGVEVESPTTNLLAETEILIELSDPQILLYENNPLLGTVFEQAVSGNFMLDRQEIDFKAVPYFFSVNHPGDFDLGYEWFINGSKIQVGPTQNTLTFRNVGDLQGKSDINLQINHLGKLLQGSATGFSLDFGKINSGGNVGSRTSTQNENFSF